MFELCPTEELLTLNIIIFLITKVLMTLNIFICSVMLVLFMTKIVSISNFLFRNNALPTMPDFLPLFIKKISIEKPFLFGDFKIKWIRIEIALEHSQRSFAISEHKSSYKYHHHHHHSFI